jgi:hypothetical protein
VVPAESPAAPAVLLHAVGLTKLFLLSPASLAGVRGAQLASARAGFAAARALRSPGGVPIAAAYAFVSALYFRGKLAYALRFAPAPEAVLVIAPGFGLVAPDWPLDGERLRRIRRVPVDARRPVYREPLRRAARAATVTLAEGAPVVLLGSVATGKYVDVLAPVFGDRLVVPRCFVGLGDMARGSRMLRAAGAGEELEYLPVSLLPRPPRPVRRRVRIRS